MVNLQSFYGLGLASLISFQVAGQKSEPLEKSLPNIVLIFIDDMGYGDLGCFGATQYSTPNIDKLASTGMRFTNFMSAQAVCSASRAGLLSGCYPNRIGFSGALGPNSSIGINANEELIPELLSIKGYNNAIVGKWHLGDDHQFLPLQNGFQEYFGLPYSNDMWPVNYDGTPVTQENHQRPGNYPPLPLIRGNEKTRVIETLKDQAQLTTLYTEYAVDFINRNKQKPFFLYLAHSMVHVPLAVSDKFKGKSKQGLFGDVVMEIDWSVGEILKTLKKNGLTKNTLVIFTSDNGPWINFGNHAGSTGGLREGKGNSFEGGQREPCIMIWPGHIPEGVICNKLASTIDILPTLAAITRSPLPERKIDGVNILPLLLGDENANPRETFLYYYRKNSLEAVRKGTWKLVFAHPGRTYIGFKPGVDGFPGKTNENFPFEECLYDLRRDPGERYNVEEYYPEVVTELKKIADDARIDLGDDIQNIKGLNRRESGRISEN